MDLVTSAAARPVEAALDFREGLSPEALSAQGSGIAEIYNRGRGKPGLIPLWVGEGDLPTPSFITDAAARSLAAGETFYTAHAGVPEFRDAIARYVSRVYGQVYEANVGPIKPDRFFVTMGGMHALQCAMRLVASSGDEIIVPTPAWPNFLGVVAVTGARAVDVPMHLGMKDGYEDWSLDIDRIAAAVTPRTRAIIINSPSNPTGWTATHDDLRSLLTLARRHKLWIIADEIYSRLVYQGDRAPSFHDVMGADDRVLFVQTFSKNWAMTGLRLGWLEAPASLRPVIENLLHYSTSGVATPLQRAGTVALDQGEAFLALQIERMTASRDILCAALTRTGRARFAMPDGAFYVFCAIDGEQDSRALAFRLMEEANIGVAPGSAFGPIASQHLRLCFARDPKQITEAARRLEDWLTPRASARAG